MFLGLDRPEAFVLCGRWYCPGSKRIALRVPLLNGELKLLVQHFHRIQFHASVLGIGQLSMYGYKTNAARSADAGQRLGNF